MDWELILKILGSFIALIGAVYQLRQFNPVKRARLKADLEILEKVDKQSENFQLVKNHIDNQIKAIYSESEKKFKIYSVGYFVFGIIFLVGFTILSVYIYNESVGFSWWLLLTGFFAFAGFGGILDGLEKKATKKTED